MSVNEVAHVPTRLSAANGSDRRAEVVDAAVRVIARDGLSGASLRSIAREIGYTTGVVMHYFKDKEELLVAVAEAAFTPFEYLLSQTAPQNSAYEDLRRLCVLPLPSDPDKEVLWRIYAQVLASAETAPAFTAAFHARYGEIRQEVRSLLARGQRTGSLRKDFDPGVECDVLCALIDGLALHAVSEPNRFPPGRLEAVVLQRLEKLRAGG